MTRLKKLLRKDADRLFSKRVRARGICEAAGWDDLECNGAFQCAHIVKRGYYSGGLRWDDRNANCLCSAHHVYFTHHPIAEERFHRHWLGRRGEDLWEFKLAAEQGIGSVIDYDEILERLRESA